MQLVSIINSSGNESEFHVSRKARDKYKFDEQLFASNGNVIFADFSAARRFAERMSLLNNRVIPASDINALGLIDEILHILVRQYELQNPRVMELAMGSIGDDLESIFKEFIDTFPPVAVYRNEMDGKKYLDGYYLNRSNRLITLDELLILHVTNQNPATSPYKELFDEEPLKQSTQYEKMIHSLKDFLSAHPGFGDQEKKSERNISLFDELLAPARIAPASLSAQLEFLLNRWGSILDEDFVQRILRGMDFIKEDVIHGKFPGGFAGNTPVINFNGRDYDEYERFSPDREWMPRLVLIAKNSYVWLDQLSSKYQHYIHHLDQIPDEELELLRQRGITGLWLIGLWERSIASQRIKQMTGQSDAVASAYSLMDYQIASDLGGWEALKNLRWRAWQKNIRLSADMVPNHMGIDSNWVIENPERFLSVPNQPFTNYSYSGPDLSNNNEVVIQIEDHYYDRSDAAVVFKRFNRRSGETNYIYHGNDGTSMPWNDTAQLDYSKPEVREAVIQTILHVARNFPIIRFDAAMTLAKKHIQRLWFPEPGHGGAIPSRAENGMTRVQFETAIPHEFWREVVDRVAAEVPDTLLLAEAFWMMEGYFVRTLGMHRVYNSAFMHMLRDEDNAKYRQVIKNTIEFEPQVLKRYVNFMNNPDEKTAAEQFGTQEKYFGVCTLMVTLPGLPMLGHGQIEGFREKYGMEYRHAKLHESVDEDLVHGHEWRIFPLLHRRALFSNVEDFRLFDFFQDDPTRKNDTGIVNEDVFAFSNRLGDERCLVVYQNKHAHTRGWIKISAAFLQKTNNILVQQKLSESLLLPVEGYVIFTDFVTGLEYIRSCRDLTDHGLYLDLGAYQCHVFLDWRISSGEQWHTLYKSLNGSGVPSINDKLNELSLLESEKHLDSNNGTIIQSRKKRVIPRTRKTTSENNPSKK
jgi:glycosidase